MLRRASVVIVLLMGCGGDDGGSGDPSGEPIPADEGASLCGAFAAHADECGWGGNVNGFDWNCGDATIVWRGDAFRSFVDCASGLACDGAGASCYTAAVDAVDPLDVHAAYSSRCNSRLDECPELATIDCRSSAFELYTNAIVEELTACFDEECTAIEDCLSGVL